jgi:hypothetical protein
MPTGTIEMLQSIYGHLPSKGISGTGKPAADLGSAPDLEAGFARHECRSDTSAGAGLVHDLGTFSLQAALLNRRMSVDRDRHCAPPSPLDAQT